MRTARPGELRLGIVLAGLTALISGFSVWVNSFGVSQVPDAILYTTLKNGVAAGVLLAVMVALARRRPSEAVAPLTTRRLAAILAVGVVGGGLAFILFFSGLAQATASGAAFIHKTLFVWVALLAVPLLGERLGYVQLGALGVLLVGQLLMTPPRAVGWGSGETMILAATLIWAGEVIVARRLLAGMSSLQLGVARLGIGLVVLVGAVIVGGRSGGIAAIGAQGWAIVGLTGLLLAAYVGTWFAALQRAPATVVTSVLVGGAVVTATLQAVAAGRWVDAPVMAGGGLILAALAIVAWVAARRRPLSPALDAGR